MMRRLTLVFLAAGLAAALAPPSRLVPLAPAPAWAATELHYISVARGEPRRQAIMAAVADFEKANPGTRVVLSEISRST